tara:strand:+ start:436 stop:603 length:168 start_codon:yes stop_codon:yes gene_type:complete
LIKEYVDVFEFKILPFDEKRLDKYGVNLTLFELGNSFANNMIMVRYLIPFLKKLK